ncbi:MAG: FkbM family methyltransferase [Rhodospirillales bacterium]
MGDGSVRPFRFNAHQSAYLAFASRNLFGGYELAETMFLEAMLAKATCFYDIGANWGYYSLLAATHPEYHGNIYSFDISEEMNLALSGMVQDLQCQTVKIMGHGLSDHAGYSKISADRATHLIRIVPDADLQQVSRAAKVDRLDDLDIPPPDIMKLDVEDHESEVLEGGRRILDEHRPLVLFESRDSEDGGKAGELLESHGYSLYSLQPRTGPDAAIDLTPLQSVTSGMDSHLNLAAVPRGDETRWFGKQLPQDDPETEPDRTNQPVQR